ERTSFANLFHASNPTILGGDLNAKSRNWHSSYDNNNGLDLEEIANDENLYVDAPMDNTYEPFQANRNGDVLDVFCFRSFSSYYTLQVHRELTSDHFPVDLS
ncbi:hypothetical protein JGG59_24135, partial [Salmonella enterica subsp. enterica serovar Derby]|nr:hypothetical protein [Salmonella enterica subsp. enterica serovar Derby]